MKWIATALVLAAAFPAASLYAKDSLWLEIEDSVDNQIVPALKENNISAIDLDWVTTPTHAKAIGSAGIPQAFKHCLAKHKIAVKDGETAKISVVVVPVERERKSNLPITKLLVKLLAGDKALLEFHRFVFGADSIVVLESLQATIPPNATSEELVAIVAAARRNPDAAAAPAGRPAETKKFSNCGKVAVELLVGETGEKDEAKFAPRPLDAKGRIVAKKGESYMLRITSSLPYTIAAAVTIDGLDWSAFYETKGGVPQRLFTVIAPNQSVVVKGWARNLDKSFAFDMAALPPEAAGKQGDAGVVVVRYAACWELGAAAPDDEPKNSPDSLSGLETKAGIEIDAKKKLVERVVGKMRGSVRVIYGAEFKD